MLSKGSALLARIASSLQAGPSGAAAQDALRTICSSSISLRMLHEPLPPTRPLGTLDGAEKPDLVDAYLSLENAASADEITAKLRAIREDFARFPGDTGSTEVQVAVLTARISSLADHLKIHRKDHNSRRGLQGLLNRRRSLLQYLRRTDFDAYAALISRLGLKDNYAPQDRFSVRYKAAVRSVTGDFVVSDDAF